MLLVLLCPQLVVLVDDLQRIGARLNLAIKGKLVLWLAIRNLEEKTENEKKQEAEKQRSRKIGIK